jgi:hypothetical protein
MHPASRNCRAATLPENLIRESYSRRDGVAAQIVNSMRRKCLLLTSADIRWVPNLVLRSLLFGTITALVLIGCSHGRHATQPLASMRKAAMSPKTEQAVARSVLLGRLREAAEWGNLFDPQSLGKLLEMDLHAGMKPAYGSPRDCGDGSISTAAVTTGSPTDTWFHTLQGGSGHLSVPAFTINPATTTGDPVVEYKMYHSVHCRDWQRLQDATEAEISFGNLPAYACVTVADIRTAIPHAQFIPATDGVYLVSLQGRLNDDSGTKLTFNFRWGVDCALGASIRQDQEDGLRNRRAQYKFAACRGPVERQFCLSHGDFGWEDREALKAMATLVYEKCGTTTTFYLKEPLTGQAPTELPSRIRQGPCG